MADSRENAKEGLSLATLMIAALASAGTALVVRSVWGPGTIVGAAMSPVLVALISEALRKPQQKVTELAPAAIPLPIPAKGRAAGVRRGPGAGDTAATPAREAQGPDRPPDRQDDPAATAIHDRRDEPGPVTGPDAGEGPRSTVFPGAVFLRRRWKLAVATGLLAFAIAATVLTTAELAAGGAATGDGRTTVFGGPGGDDAGDEAAPGTDGSEETAPPADPTAPEEAPTAPEAAPAEPTPSPSPAPTATPTPAPAPAEP